MADKVREKALSILLKIYEEGAFSNLELNRELENTGLRPVDRAFITELVYGTLSWTITLDYVINKFSKLRVDKISEKIMTILRMGLYQIFFLDRVPAAAACNESVKLAGKYGHEGSKRFVNGILRNILRQTGGDIENMVFPDREKFPAEYLSARYGYQPWIVKKILASHDFDFAENIMQAGNSAPALTARCNFLKTNREKLLALLREEGLKCREGEVCEEAIILDAPFSARSSAAFTAGLFTIQGESSMLAAKVLEPRPGERILDMCSAPGGKSTHIAELMGNKGHILAADIFPHKLQLVEKACKRLGISIVETINSDGTIFNPAFENSFDRVLVDAPCSGLGMVRKKPEIKIIRKEEDIAALVAIQKKLLENAARYVKPGGVLVYSTCTILDEENLDLVNAFLAENTIMEAEDFSKLLPEKLRTMKAAREAQKGYLRLFTGMGNLDGFFIARMRKKTGQ